MNVPGAFAKHFKCPCCSNPWNQSGDVQEGGSGSGSDEMTDAAIPCQPCLDDTKGFAGIDPGNFDMSVSPKDNFYKWSNGGWKAKNPIPGEYPCWNTFIVLRDLNLDRLKAILDELAANTSGSGTLDPKLVQLSDFFNSFMDIEGIEARGVTPLLEIIAQIQNPKTDVTDLLAALHSKYKVFALFSLFSTPDKKNSEHTLGAIYQSGLGLPDRDYYFDEDKSEKRSKYVAYIEALFALLGTHGVAPYTNASLCAQAAKDVFALESELAGAHLTRTAARDPEVTYNKMSVADLQLKTKVFPKTYGEYLSKGNHWQTIDWARYFLNLGKPIETLGDVNVAMVEATKKACALANTASSSFAHYLVFHVVNKYAPHLPKAFVDLHFEFNDKELKGTAEQLPRWKRALASLEDALGDTLGQLYVSKYFPEEYKAKALSIVENVRDALRARLEEVDWMSASTRAEALKKMERFRVKIGFPDKWLDYSSMKITKGTHFENLLENYKYQMNLELSRMNAPTDRERWFMTPQTVNAYYHPSLNEIVFPAAILQPPFFDSSADLAVQFGSLGAVIGHEMTHGFDDQGRKYDFEGNMRDWWTSDDGKEYESRAAVMIKQAEEFEVYGVKLKGKLTQGENIADLGGIKLALRALKKQLSLLPNPPPLINGFTPEQRFFLAWSQAWRENSKKERALQMVTLDPHGPNELRCNGPLSNVTEFLEAFNIQEGDPMFKPVNERVDIW